MNLDNLILILQTQPLYAALSMFVLSGIAYVLFRFVVARWLMNLSVRSQNKYDDMLMRYLKPYRMAWLAPLIVITLTSSWFPEYGKIIAKTSLFMITWLSVLTLVNLLTAINNIYESRPNYKGVSIAGYLDAGKILFMVIGLILSVTIFTDKSPIALLTGLGAMAAGLLLIFQSTIQSLVASIQIAANDLIKEGDWIEVPSYDADGTVENITLNSIKIRNFDMTYSVIPTNKIVEVAFRNWRGMVESGGRRIQRSIMIDQLSIKFCSIEMLKSLQKIDLLANWLNGKINALESYAAQHQGDYDLPLDGPQITNTEVFREYIDAYLKSRGDIHTETLSFLVRALAPNPTGVPIEIYVFAKTTTWEAYEMIQSAIFDHLLAAVGIFGLRVFQEPTGLDFAKMALNPHRE